MDVFPTLTLLTPFSPQLTVVYFCPCWNCPSVLPVLLCTCVSISLQHWPLSPALSSFTHSPPLIQHFLTSETLSYLCDHFLCNLALALLHNKCICSYHERNSRVKLRLLRAGCKALQAQPLPARLPHPVSGFSPVSLFTASQTSHAISRSVPLYRMFLTPPLSSSEEFQLVF